MGRGAIKVRPEEKELGQSLRELFEIELDLQACGPRGTARALHEQLRAAILDGRLLPGVKLPPSRRSGAYFGVSRNTVNEVYSRLLSEGLVEASPGSGTYVSHHPPLADPAARPHAEPPPGAPLNPFWRRDSVRAAQEFWRLSPAASGAGTIEFRPGVIDTKLFPFDLFRQLVARQLRRLEGAGNYEVPLGRRGRFALRAAIATHIALTRAVLCQPDDVLVTAGAQQAFDLLARTLVTPGETVVAVEDPCYPPMRIAFAAAGAQIVPVPVDEEGMMVDAIPPEARIICVCPSHQFPLGVTLSKRRRLALEQEARRRGAVIIEDDYDGEFRYGGAALQALHRPETADLVFYVGTFSKCMFPALRLGFIVAPDWAQPTLTLVKSSLDWHCPTTLQDGLADFIAGGHLARHIRKMRQIYDERRLLLLERLERDFAPWLKALPSDYGIHVAALAVGDDDLEAVSASLPAQGVNILTLKPFLTGETGPRGLIFSFGITDLAAIERGLDLLHTALAQKSTQRPPFSQSL